MTDSVKKTGEAMFEDSLDEFSNRIGIIISLQQGNKMTVEEAFAEVKSLYKRLKKNRRNLLDQS